MNRLNINGDGLPRFSQIDLDFVKQYLYVDFDEDDMMIRLFVESAKEMVIEQTGEPTYEMLDGNRLASVIVLMIVSDLYNTRSTTATDVKIKFSPLFTEMKRALRGTMGGYKL